MSGFDNGSLQSGVFAQTKQFGSILRGYGAPTPTAGVLGDLYIDLQTWQLYAKRQVNSIDPWGHYLFVVPTLYRNTLKWFSTSLPDRSLGVDGDYCFLWSGFSNYGLQASVYGPKADGSWPESGDGYDYFIAAGTAGFVLPVGVTDESAYANPFSVSTQLIAEGVSSEVILPVPVLADAGAPVSQVGMYSMPGQMTLSIDPLYTAVDQYAVS